MILNEQLSTDIVSDQSDSDPHAEVQQTAESGVDIHTVLVKNSESRLPPEEVIRLKHALKEVMTRAAQEPQSLMPPNSDESTESDE